MTLKINILELEKVGLREIEKYESNWRIRERAKTLLAMERGFKFTEIAKMLGISVQTIRSTFHGWQACKFDSLPDNPRSGAPTKITEAQLKEICQEAEAQPLTAVQLLDGHMKRGGDAVHLNTIRSALHKSGYVSKRTRGSLKKKGSSGL